ncbi:DNA-binding transcriptional regulator, LysR family [Roseovarius azorensis]|uniref:DNA-binding transcriptional regulator, LysR family n=1 Tax=Roseovarius azorensis TaxID=1287727 RepID=A0A1H7Y3A1_9RHOB|nr:LysR family transcriptional regulator [Roseovarius azorensis]SEM39808.1 DNA-binding transcriptional regulator, LysR family [Roseovarius azorensis]
MNLTFLQTFLTVIETGNLNKAAERLNVTQSTVTTRIDALEDALGRRLLVRSRRGTRLTRAGFELRPHAELLVHGWAQARKAINLPKGYSGLFSFACEFDLWHDLGQEWIYQTRTAHPELAYEARPGRRNEIAAWLGSGLTDLAMTIEPISGSGLASQHFCEQKIVHVSTQTAPFATPDPDYVFVDLGPDFRRQHSSAFPNASTAGMTFSISYWALEHLRAHGGSAYLPLGLVAPLLDNKELHLVTASPEFVRNVHLVWREANEVIFPWMRADT